MILEIPTKNMLKTYMKSIEIDEIYHQSKLIKIMNLIKKIPKLDSITVNRNPGSKNELANKN